MNRQVDVKALVSHIIKGDGLDKCRICMGDTSQGQVHLGDTVMMDGDKPVTLSELLELITGVTVDEETDLPPGLCRDCTEDIITAVTFKQLFKQSNQYWEEAVSYLTCINDPAVEDKTLILFYPEEKPVYNIKEPAPTTQCALDVLNKPKRVKIKNKRFSCCCPNCNKKFSCIEKLNEHFRFTLQRFCHECGTGVNKKRLAKHLLNIHKIEVLECKSCHDVFRNHVEARRHWVKYHGSGTHSCSFCGTGFQSERGLRAHSYLHTLFNCPCGSTFENARCHKYHISICKPNKHILESNFECDYCGVVYDKKPSLRTHIVQKHLYVLPFVCQTCGKRTSTLSHLRSHEKTHETERKVLECRCGAKFRSNLGYKLHMRIHSGDKPFKCTHCEESFLSASRRLDHVKRRHQSSKEMPHGCSECSAKFLRPWELKKHSLNAHGSVVNVQRYKRDAQKAMKTFRSEW